MKIKYQAGTVMPDEYDYTSDFNALDTTIPYTEMDTGKVLGLAIAHQQKENQITEHKTNMVWALKMLYDQEKGNPVYEAMCSKYFCKEKEE